MGKLVNESLKLFLEVLVLIGLVAVMMFAILGVSRKRQGMPKGNPKPAS